MLALLLVACPASSRDSAADAPTGVTEAPEVVAGSCGLQLAASATAEESVRAMLVAEGELLVAQDIDGLMELWADASRIIDAKNTPTSDEDDQIWDGKDAIRHRYVRTVFPGAPSSAGPADLDISVSDKRAEVLATTQIGAEVSPQGDRWTLVQNDGCWYLESLTYNLEPTQ